MQRLNSRKALQLKLKLVYSFSLITKRVLGFTYALYFINAKVLLKVVHVFMRGYVSVTDCNRCMCRVDTAARGV